jgi:uncharacterized protein YkwD
MTWRGFTLWSLCALAGAASLPAQNVSEQYLLAAANQDRAAHGLPPVKVDAHLVLAARDHAHAMAVEGTISHQFAGGQARPERTSR